MMKAKLSIICSVVMLFGLFSCTSNENTNSIYNSSSLISTEPSFNSYISPTENTSSEETSSLIGSSSTEDLKSENNQSSKIDLELPKI